MTAPEEPGPDEFLRLFYGLPVPGELAAVLAAWASETLGGRPTVRILPAEHLHATLAFLGNRPARELPALRGALHDAADGLEPPVLALERYRETRSVAMLVLSDAGDLGARIQERLVGHLEELGVYEREQRPWLAHVTVARLRERPRLRPQLPDVPAFRPSEAALYRSRIGRAGARYEILETASLRA